MKKDLERRLAALEASNGAPAEQFSRRARKMSDDELLHALFESGEPGYDISLFPGATLAERADAVDRVIRGELEVSAEAMYAARGHFAIAAAMYAGVQGDDVDRFVAEWIAERYGSMGATSVMGGKV